jgi:hypothetical protein
MMKTSPRRLQTSARRREGVQPADLRMIPSSLGIGVTR